MTDRRLVLYHSPNTRSTGALALLEQLEADYTLRVLDMKGGEQRRAAYLAVNPMGKVPALLHGEALVTEQVAVYLYAADLYADRGLAPQMGDPLRGPYLRWLAFYGSSFEPALVDRALKREAPPPSMSPYGDFDTMWNTLLGQLARGPWMLGERLTAADVLWGTALDWTTRFGIVTATPAVQAYIERTRELPGVRKAREKDAALAAPAS